MDGLITNEKIYKTGIKNKGIDYIIPKRLTQDSYEKLGLLMNEADRKIYKNCYTKEKDYYILKKQDIKELTPIIEEASIINYMFYSALQSKSSQEKTLGFANPSGVYNILKGKNEKQRTEYLKEAKNTVRGFSDKIKKDYAYKSIVVEEGRFGKSPNTLRDQYISKQLIHLLLDIVILILTSILEIFWLKNKNIKPFQNIILFILIEIYLWNQNILLNLSILGIAFVLGILLYLREKNKKRKPQKLERQLEKKILEIQEKINPSMIWLGLTITFAMINQIIYGLYTSYHIFVGMDAEKVVHQINGLECNIILILLLGVFLLKWKREIKVEEYEVVEKQIKKKIKIEDKDSDKENQNKTKNTKKETKSKKKKNKKKKKK